MNIVANRRRVSKPAPITVRLPDLESVPLTYRGKPYTLNTGLLSDGDSNPKLLKSNRAGTVYKTWGISLAPSTASGYQVCASASPGCASSCLHFQGHGRVFPSIPASRVAKTIAFFEERDWFADMLRFQLASIARRAEQERFIIAVRPNLFSDITWENVFPWMFTDFPDIQFYDYTKHLLRALRVANGEFPENYHLTFSRSETNHGQAMEVLRAGGNVAVVFRDKNFPQKWNRFPVVSGDETDLRFLDPSPRVVALYAKGSAKQDRSGFVMDTKTSRVPLPLVKA